LGGGFEGDGDDQAAVGSRKDGRAESAEGRIERIGSRKRGKTESAEWKAPSCGRGLFYMRQLSTGEARRWAVSQSVWAILR